MNPSDHSILQSIEDIQAFVRHHPKIHIIGKGSKTGLHGPAKDSAVANLANLSGISEYRPEEYTLTVRAATPIYEIQTELQKQGQYLPFDPPDPAHATIGGTVASNLSGSRRFRYGGLRDFILGAKVVDGLGRAFGVGGKVVKNAAGFDLSKFLVGSMGQYAMIIEMTFKVFPDAPTFRGLQLQYRSLPDLLSALYFINQSVYELDALDFEPQADQWSLLARLAGFEATLPQRLERFIASMKTGTALIDLVELGTDMTPWNPLKELSLGTRAACLVKVPLSPKQIPPFDAMIAATQRRYSAGGNVAWVAVDDIDRLDAALRQHGLSGLCIRGAVDSPLVGKAIDNVLAQRVKQALDPQNKFV